MAISGILMSNGTANQKPREFKNNLDKDSFLNLLVVQLKNQNPLQPMEDKEFIAQMAQFTNLETTQNMSRTMKINSAYNMVNKLATAYYTDEGSGETKKVIGAVEKVRVDNERIFLNIEGKEVLFDSVEEVTDMISPVEQMQMINQSFGQVYAFSMIGKTVKAKVNNEELEGVVDKIKMDNGKVYLTVNDKDISLGSVSEVK
jgi:flagellar basal-body rod modification protein FlgD